MDRAAKLKLGGFTAASLAGLAALVVLFGGAPRVFDSRARYVIVFGEAPGVNIGTPVRKSGVRIGEVTALDLDPTTGKVRVGIAVESQYLPRLNEEPTIVSGLLNGDTTVDFAPKLKPDGQPVTSFGEAVPPNTEIAGVSPISPNQFFRQASGVLPSAQESMARILESVKRFELATPKIEKAFEEFGLLAQSGREFLPELRKTNDRISPLIEDVRGLVKANEADITATVKSIRKNSENLNDVLSDENRKAFTASVKNVQTASENVADAIKIMSSTLTSAEKTIKNIDERVSSAERVFKNIEAATKPLADNSDAVVKNVTVAADQLAKTLAELRMTMAALNRTDGSFAKVMNDPALFNNLNSSAASLSRTLMQAEKIAQDLQVFSDKIARRPEIIGLGGALRPSAGLKDTPATKEPCLPPSPLEVPSFKPLEPIPPTRGDLPPN